MDKCKRKYNRHENPTGSALTIYYHDPDDESRICMCISSIVGGIFCRALAATRWHPRYFLGALIDYFDVKLFYTLEIMENGVVKRSAADVTAATASFPVSATIVYANDFSKVCRRAHFNMY